MSAENSSYSEEEMFVYVEFEDNVNIDEYENIHVLGIDTKNPIIQLDDTFFMGKFENPLGTYMFFADDPSPQCLDPLFDKIPEKCLQYLSKTRKCIKVQHAYITPKVADTEGQEKNCAQKQTTDNDIEPLKFKNVHDALQVFQKELSASSSTTHDSKT